MRRLIKLFLVVVLLVASWTTAVFHRVVLVRPADLPPATKVEHGRWYGRAAYGVNHLFVWGNPYERGLAAGALTKDLMKREETELVAQFQKFFPNRFVRWGLTTGMMRWFWGIDRELEPWMLHEMYGVAQSASPEFDWLLDPYTRQLAYHGLHEVGQMFVDFQRADVAAACTVFVVPQGKGWLVGRNFDFEGGRIFDEEKIVKWITPERGHRIVAVTWAGMVGLVTGVNDAGVYLSINAAGSADFRRYGMPTTLVALKALQFARSAEEAVHILEGETTFITDIFVVGDGKQFYRVEKSPERTTARPIHLPTVVTNHLTSPAWSIDKINAFRREKLTSETRMKRGERLLRSAVAGPEGMLGLLRDKRNIDGDPLPLGNRAAIDALIASHSVIYDTAARVLYVSRGPSLAGGYDGYDLAAGFAGHGPPKVVARLPADPEVGPGVYANVKESARLVGLAESAIKRNRCDEAEKHLGAVPYRGGSDLAAAEGDLQRCLGDRDRADEHWREALRRGPAYPEQREALEKKVGRL